MLRQSSSGRIGLIDIGVDFHKALMHIGNGIWCPDSSNSWIGVSPVGTQARFGGLGAFMGTPSGRIDDPFLHKSSVQARQMRD